MTTAVTNPTMCTWCNSWIHRGEKCLKLTAGKFNEHIHKLLTSICNKHADRMGPGLKLHMLSFIVTRHPGGVICDFQAYCTDCGLFDIKFSRYGRTIVAPMRLQDETFVSGSGFSGCDHYDTGYDNGVITDGKKDFDGYSNMLDFIVDDNSLENTMNCNEQNTDSGEEKEWSDYESEEEDFDDDMDWD